MKVLSLTVLVVMLASAVGLAAGAELRYNDSILDLTELFIPQGIQLSSPPADLELPDGLTGDVSYGVIPLNGQGFPVILDRDGEDVRLYVRPDPKAAFVPVPWKQVFSSGERIAHFEVRISYTTGLEPYALLAVWDPAYPTVLVYFRGGYREGKVLLNGEYYKIAVVDENTSGRYDDLAKGTLFIDTDRDGKLLTSRDSHERFSLDEPFNIGGTVYAVKSISADGARIVIEESDTYVPEKQPLGIGYPAPDFSGRTTDGEDLSLSGLKGKIVVLDFWAGWCRPCIIELPNVKKLASDYKDNGVVVLGINLDRTEKEFEQAVSNNGIDYPQIYDGPDGPIAATYRVTAIPMTYVIDRDGTIAGKNLRGDDLRQAVEKLVNPEG